MKNIRVLIADDSALMRQTLRRILSGHPDIEIAGVARDGEDAVAKARELRPDVATMDINMPKLDGVSALQILVQEKICPVVMLSSLTQAGAVTTFECLELGAFDFVAKPDGTVSSNMAAVGEELVAKLRAASRGGVLEKMRERRRGFVRTATPPVAKIPPAGVTTPSTKAVAIGISTGGPATITNVLPLLPADLNASVFLVQHMPASFLTTFARRLDAQCSITVVEAQSGMKVQPGVCYLAAGGLHLCVFRRNSGEVIIRTPSQPRTLFVPSVNVMMESVLGVYGANTIGVLMTGIGDDGADQMVEITRRGGHTIAESEETAVVYGMPREAFERGGASVVAPSYRVAEEILRAVRANR